MKRDGSTGSWDAIAHDWVQHADGKDYRNVFLMPRLLAMLSDVDGQRILDLGSGEGGVPDRSRGLVFAPRSRVRHHPDRIY